MPEDIQPDYLMRYETCQKIFKKRNNNKAIKKTHTRSRLQMTTPFLFIMIVFTDTNFSYSRSAACVPMWIWKAYIYMDKCFQSIKFIVRSSVVGSCIISHFLIMNCIGTWWLKLICVWVESWRTGGYPVWFCPLWLNTGCGQAWEASKQHNISQFEDSD